MSQALSLQPMGLYSWQITCCSYVDRFVPGRVMRSEGHNVAPENKLSVSSIPMCKHKPHSSAVCWRKRLGRSMFASGGNLRRHSVADSVPCL